MSTTRRKLQNAAYQRAFRIRNLETQRTEQRVRKYRKLDLPEPTRPAPEACECCGQKCKSGRHLANDHDHTTGKFRGWLCFNCNTGIGRMGDSIEAITRALEYLKRAS